MSEERAFEDNGHLGAVRSITERVKKEHNFQIMLLPFRVNSLGFHLIQFANLVLMHL